MTIYYIYSLSHATDASVGRYIGSTRNLPRRLACHKHHSSLYPNHHLYKLINETGGWKSWVLKTLQTVYSDNPEDRRKAEQEWIDRTTGKINRNKAYCPYVQYYQEHKDQINDRKRTYYERNREAIRKRRAEQHKIKRQAYVAELAAKGLHPKKSSKNDPPKQQPPLNDEKMDDNVIQNDCECVQVQCEEQTVYGDNQG